MIANLRSWWQRIMQHRIAIGVTVLWQRIMQHRIAIGVTVLALGVAIALIIAGYRFNWTGFNGYNKVSIVRTISGTSAGTVTRTEEYQPGKTLWDWMQLLIIPVMIAIGGFWLNQLQKSREERHAEMLEGDKQHEASLQAYLANIRELLLEKQLRESAPDDEIRKTARVLTLIVLPHLGSTRKKSVLRFLYDSHLIDKDNTIIGLYGADLSGADLRWAYLPRANLREVQLYGADLSKANLSEAALSKAKLTRANLRETHLSEAHLRNATLYGADLSEADLSGARLWGAQMDKDTDLRGAKLQRAEYNKKEKREKDAQGKLVTTQPTQWPPGFDPQAVGAICVEH